MSYDEQFKEMVQQYTPHQLYLAYKKAWITYCFREPVPIYSNINKRLDIITAEANKRGLDKLIDIAMEDGYGIVAARRLGLPIPNITRIDYMNETELLTKIRNMTLDSGIEIMDSEKRINSLDFLSNNLSPTIFIMYAEGDSMLQAGIEEGDALAVESAETNYWNKICVVSLGEKLYIKKIIKTTNGVILHSANPKYHDYLIKETDELKFVGVLKWIVKRIRHNF